MQLSQALRISSGDVVAFVGGGGKTTAMFQLARALTQTERQKMRVLITTSTRIFAAQIKLAPAHISFNPSQQNLIDILPRLEAAIEQHGQVLLIGQADPDSGKAFGVSPEVVDALAATGQFDVILNEADGSRMRPFKAPAGHEPVIPSTTTVVVPVVGLDALNLPLTDEHVHRAELVHRLSGTPLEHPISPETITTVLGHAQGGLKNVPAQARVIPLLNKVDDAARLAAGRAIAARLLENDAIDSVVLGTVREATRPIVEVQGRVGIVILAAGGSSRFGSPKQLATWAGKTFLEQTADTALAVQGVQQITVVLGAEVEQSQRLLEKHPVQIVINPRWAEGQSTSMRAGLVAQADNLSSLVFMLVDLPRVTPEIITALIERHRQSLAPIVWPEFEGRRGNPVLFDQALFPDLAHIQGDTGGRPLIQAFQSRAERVVVATSAVVQDFDRPEDLEAARRGEIRD